MKWTTVQKINCGDFRGEPLTVYQVFEHDDLSLLAMAERKKIEHESMNGGCALMGLGRKDDADSVNPEENSVPEQNVDFDGAPDAIVSTAQEINAQHSEPTEQTERGE